MAGILQISETWKNNVDLVTFSGRMDTNTSMEAEAVLTRLIRAGSRSIVVNLKNLDYISSSGLRVLLLSLQKIKKNQGDLKLACPKPSVREVFHMAGFDRIFLLYESEDEAVQSFGYVALDDRERRIMEVVASTIDIEEDRRRTEESLKQSETLYRAIFENTGTAMAIVDDDMTIFLANAEFAKMVGYAKEELDEVMSFLSFVVRDDLAKAKEFHDLVRNESAPGPKHCEIRIKDVFGNIRTIWMILDMIPDTPRRVYSLNDITELRKIEDDLRYELTRKREFITFVSHELRTPLQPIIGYLHLILDKPDEYGVNPEARAFLEKCRENIDREREMIEQIIKFSGLGCSMEQVLPQFLPLYRRISPFGILKSHITLIRCPQTTSISIAIPENLTLVTDSEYFYLIMLSLIFNSLRYAGSQAKIEIAHHEDDTWNYFAVMDAGTEISREILVNVFEPFYVGDESRLRKKFGFIGLSLPLAKKMAQVLGGDITVTSGPGTGTEFTLKLPKAVPKQDYQWVQGPKDQDSVS